VTGRHRIAVPQPVNKFVPEEGTLRRRVAEETGCREGIGDDEVLAKGRIDGIIYEWAGLA
jgi:hypothetical protein